MFRADGKRAWKSSNNGGWFSYYLYDGDDLICELDSTGNVQSDGSYAYGPNGLVLRRDVSIANRYLTYAFDPLGSHVQTLYFNGSSVSIRRFSVYDAFGKRHWDKTSSGSDTNNPGSVGFVGQWGCYTDHETRTYQNDTPLVLMGIRYYDPITARFLTRDPALGINDYAYCGNNPVGRVDADGEILETIADAASIGWSTYDLIKNPSWANVGYLAWDVGATAIPFVPGSYTAKGVKLATKGIKAARGTKAAKAITKGRRVAKAVAHGCFVAGTLVATPDGSKPIELVQTGDAVWAFDDTVGPVGLARPSPDDTVGVLDGDLRAVRHAALGMLQPGTRVCFLSRVYEVSKGQGTRAIALVDTGIVSASVSHTFQHIGDSAVGAIIDVLVRTADGKETVLHATPNHPFYVPSRREYVQLGELTPGTPLRTTDRQQATIVAMSTRKGKFAVYNLEVGGSHNYYVSDLNVLVHNKAAWAGIKLTSAIGKDARLVRAAKAAGKSVQGDIDHLVAELARGNLNPGIGSKSLFGNISYARTKGGARVFFRKTGERSIEIVGKSSKHNEDEVIAALRRLYGH